MKPSYPAAVMTVVILGLAAGTGCSAAAKHAEPSAAPPSTAAVCPTGPALPLPKDFPETLPVPDGAVLTSVEHRTGGRLVVATVVPGGFEAALTFLQKRLPETGYALKEGEVEADDAESNFSSRTVEGRWTLRKLPACEGEVELTYLTSAVS
ncbi:hypothetical protein GCM10022403_017510 [Streptomyces coacervatus]|uniref:Lipoprotein n=1 Tax=Streptomyces coacervatus TaxID=647381 RepID=A0ABP7H704_9ACTN|nr:hypothetical protein [Streptomyces coacervatus]MDF2271619.1 hypothetical protein [Streptomyces coacervatus]